MMSGVSQVVTAIAASKDIYSLSSECVSCVLHIQILPLSPRNFSLLSFGEEAEEDEEETLAASKVGARVGDGGMGVTVS